MWLRRGPFKNHLRIPNLSPSTGIENNTDRVFHTCKIDLGIFIVCLNGLVGATKGTACIASRHWNL